MKHELRIFVNYAELWISFFSIADKEPRYALASVGQIRLTDSAGERIEWACFHEWTVVSIRTISMANQ
jgi:hypothetical protein